MTTANSEESDVTEVIILYFHERTVGKTLI
jgi:hypothetical protein